MPVNCILCYPTTRLRKSTPTTSLPASLTATLTNSASVSPTGGGYPVEINNSTFNNYFLEAQNWVGVDVDPPDCTADPDNILCADPDAANRIVKFKSQISDCYIHFLIAAFKANLYNDTIIGPKICRCLVTRSRYS